MFKIVAMFLLMFGAFFFGIIGYREMTGRERWAFRRLLAYSAGCAALAVLSLVVIVLLF